MICLPEAQECNDLPCDTGSPRETLEGDSEFEGFNFSRLNPDWTSKKNLWAADAQSIAKRAQSVRHFLRDRPEQSIVVVAHGDILRQITCGANGPSNYMWKNGEIRIFKFQVSTAEGEDCFLVPYGVVDAAHGFARTSTEKDLPSEANGKL